MTTVTTGSNTASLYIGGEWTAPDSDETIEVTNAATEQVMGSVPAGT